MAETEEEKEFAELIGVAHCFKFPSLVYTCLRFY
jgi:hypothetical protein